MAGAGEESGPERTDNDEELDLRSEKFDPQRALYSKSVRIPVEDAKTYDNVAMYASKMKALAAGKAGPSSAAPKAPKPAKNEARNVGRFLPHQLPVKSTFVPGSDVISRMDKESGPLAVLKDCMQKKIRVKVVTRNDRNIRGYCTGFVEAFDRQWNIAMRDVIEVWNRRKKKKVIPGHDDLKLDSSRLSGAHKRLLAKVPVVQVTAGDKGEERCERHVPQLLMRGEHVVLIAVSGR